MISFIVIGKNEGWKLTKCFESIFNFISKNKIESSEVIYVDSKSTDDSIERAKGFSEIKVFLITGECNAAIARNIGAKESSGEILFFIDGDMELNPDFYKVAFDENNKLVYPFISGGLINYNFDSSWNLISTSNYSRNVKKDKYEHTTGGIFIVERELWYIVGGMRTKYMRNQDLDLGFRISKMGFPILRKTEIIANHYTIPYLNYKRSFKLILNGSEFYPSVLFRNNIFNIHASIMYCKENYSLIVLLIIFLIVILTKIYPLLYIYIFILLIKVLRMNGLNFSTLLFMVKMILRDLIRFYAFFLFWPNEKKLEYKKVE